MVNWYVETVKEKIGEHIVSSDIRVATEKDIEEARLLHSKGECPHNVVVDDYGWMYDIRSCAICGAGLGVV